jgi:hypothetical protein
LHCMSVSPAWRSGRAGGVSPPVFASRRRRSPDGGLTPPARRSGRSTAAVGQWPIPPTVRNPALGPALAAQRAGLTSSSIRAAARRSPSRRPPSRVRSLNHRRASRRSSPWRSARASHVGDQSAPTAGARRSNHPRKAQGGSVVPVQPKRPQAIVAMTTR